MMHGGNLKLTKYYLQILTYSSFMNISSLILLMQLAFNQPYKLIIH